MPLPICAIYLASNSNPILVIANHESDDDIEIQNAISTKIPALNGGFNFAVLIRQKIAKI